MTKKKFLKELETKLSKIESTKRKNIIDRYSEIIDKEIESGKTEKEAVKDCGSIDLIVKLVSNDKEKTVETRVSLFINNIIDFISDVFNKIDEKTAKMILEIIAFCFIAIIGIWILYIPFKLMEIIGIGLFGLFFNYFAIFRILSFLWSLIIHIVFLILIIWIFAYYIDKIKQKYENINKNKGE